MPRLRADAFARAASTVAPCEVAAVLLRGDRSCQVFGGALLLGAAGDVLGHIWNEDDAAHSVLREVWEEAAPALGEDLILRPSGEPLRMTIALQESSRHSANDSILALEARIDLTLIEKQANSKETRRTSPNGHE